ncbi:MAG: hypothetical protein A4E27_00633 [Methanobacterium sp. PtaU1.Bin242]|nr:MAG: hypothetical protein A4E27_00633 [Methanobacterium sp. PtaU1.Bin242]
MKLINLKSFFDSEGVLMNKEKDYYKSKRSEYLTHFIAFVNVLVC